MSSWNQGWLDGCEIWASPNFDERPENAQVELLVIHNISLPAGEFGGPHIKGLFTNTLDTSAHETFAELENLRVSAHFLIRRDGQCVQLVSVDKRAWHAGKSCWRKRETCNDFSVGIELEGCDDLPFDGRQYQSLAALTKALIAYFPMLTPNNITGHSDIAPGRKQILVRVLTGYILRVCYNCTLAIRKEFTLTQWLTDPAATINPAAAEQALERLSKYDYPEGALGRLQPLIMQLAALQSPDTDKLRVGKASISLFAADHGVYSEQVSSLPEDSTAQRITRFSESRLVSSLLAKGLRARAELVNLGTRKRVAPSDGVLDLRITAGTANCCREPAMTKDQFEEAAAAGLAAAERAEGYDLFIGGDIGAGNTTVAAAMAAAHTRLGAPTMVGDGSGVDAQMRAKKVAVVNRAVSLHLPRIREPTDLLLRLGGFEIAALSAAYIANAQRGRAVLVDGYVCAAAAMAALQINPSIKPWLIFAQRNTLEPGHERVLRSLSVQPLLDLDLRVGEAVGALLAVPMVQAACAIYNNAR